MTDSTFLVYVVLIASTAHELKAASLTPSAVASIPEEVSWWQFIVYPAYSLQATFKNQLAPAFKAKNDNDIAKKTDINEYFESLTSRADGLRKEIENMGEQLERTFAPDFKEKVGGCKVLYETWQRTGVELAARYHQCRENDEPVAKKHMENLVKVEEHLFSVLEDYYNSIEGYRNMGGFLSGLRSLVSSIWIYFKWLFSESTVHSEMALYIESSQFLQHMREIMAEDDACVSPSRVNAFHELAEKMESDIGVCMMRGVKVE